MIFLTFVVGGAECIEEGWRGRPMVTFSVFVALLINIYISMCICNVDF